MYLRYLRYNKLLAVISQSLNDIVKALKGLVVMSSELELMANSLFNNAVPDMWKGKASETQPLPTSRYRRVNNVAIATQCFLALSAAVVLSQNKPTPSPPPGLPVPEASGLLGDGPASED